MFSKLPTWWIRSGDISLFKSNELGKNIASLKCYLALALKMDFFSNKYKVSTYDLEIMTSLSRPMVTKGLKNLENLGFITIDKSEHTYTYHLVERVDDNRWAKMPTRSLSKALKDMKNNRLRTTLLALKVYVYLLSIRSNDANYVSVTHETIRSNTFIQPDQVRPAIDVLINFGLIAVSKGPGKYKYTCHESVNYYYFLGLKVQ